ncbi:uncharacterized protein PADG_05859 [Paracoccidioides brasiliensis Pb18]|uniref:Uncharacterized protein n=1 Tax=Paracoccidioides brasiliensis (strain Pb18) TaxID=502780 RepID=C1GF23_PARBD|nr:uncharacterized protein PADG_05859 [Paracoccidioides brasiliensis Pb18]EEH49780.1 hypothetical protein PADG_05859 [Paracoccidioides brasiliensis Pb18]ODH51699.1 hypothetical protein GX48_02166 [Paracoccidioides brasiliensis]
MAATQFYSNISLDTEDDDEILEKAKVCYPVWMLSKVFETDISAIQLDNQLREFQVEIDRQWTPYMVKMVVTRPSRRFSSVNIK